MEAKVEQTQFFKDEFTEDDVEMNNEGNSTTQGKWVNKQRTLIVASRGVSHQERHLINDLMTLLPHAKKEAKIEKSIAKDELSEICFNHSCKNGLYFEHRKREFVLWMFKSQNGPCAKFQIRNIHTLTEIKLTGNNLKFSRPLLSFDKSFDTEPHLRLLKELFLHIFNSPKNHPKTKPFYDHVICLYNVNNNIFFRNYQILNEMKEKFCNSDNIDKLQLSEVGPRFALCLMRIMDGPSGGKTLYKNPFYLSPSTLIKKNADRFKKRKFKEGKEKEALNEKLIKAGEINDYMWLDDQ